MMNVPESFLTSSPYLPSIASADHRPDHLPFFDAAGAASYASLSALPDVGNSNDLFQFYPSSQYLAGPPAALPAYAPALPSPAALSLPYYPTNPVSLINDYYFGGPIGAADDTVSIAATHLGLNLGYRTYFPPRGGGYGFGHHHQPPRCQAEGCKADLSRAKRYHRRHKVCEFHSKASVVVISGGLHQRFCQQCSRFHALDEFDDVKKSCRKRLADHNRRRRKPKPGAAGSVPAGTATDKKKLAKNKAQQKATSKIKPAPPLLGKAANPSLSLAAPAEVDRKLPFLPILEGRTAAPATLHEHQHSSLSFPSPSPANMCYATHHQGALGYPNADADVVPAMGYNTTQQHAAASNLLQLGQAIFELDFI